MGHLLIVDAIPFRTANKDSTFMPTRFLFKLCDADRYGSSADTTIVVSCVQNVRRDHSESAHRCEEFFHG